MHFNFINGCCALVCILAVTSLADSQQNLASTRDNSLVTNKDVILMTKSKFDDATIQDLFGVEDAEREKPDRLKQYFFRNKAYQRLGENLPIRILVGHKGVGKSALLRMSYLDDENAGTLAVGIQPSDVIETQTSGIGINAKIEKWKVAIGELIYRKVLTKIGIDKTELANPFTGNSLIELIAKVRELFQSNKTTALIDAAGKALVAGFLKHNTIRVYIDDLDRGWKAKTEDIENISALLNAVRDFCGSDNRVQIRVALRTDVYFL